MKLEFDEHGYLSFQEEPLTVDCGTAKEYFGISTPERELLWASVEGFLRLFIAFKVPALSVWIGGSFTTLNPLPNDVRIVVFLSKEVMRGNRLKTNMLDSLFQKLTIKWAELNGNPDEDSTGWAIDKIERMKRYLWLSSDMSGGAPKGFINLKID